MNLMRSLPPIFIYLMWQTLLLTSCNSNPPQKTSILPIDLQLETGDVVFRCGESFDSQLVLTADTKGRYTHIGIVVDSGNYKMIVHAVPGEHDFPGDTDRIKMDSPKNFFHIQRASIGEVMRLKQKGLAISAARTALRLYHKHLLFDHDYDDTDTTRMYCTELVLYAYHTAGLDLCPTERDTFYFPIHFKGYLPSAVHDSPYLQSVRTF